MRRIKSLVDCLSTKAGEVQTAIILGMFMKKYPGFIFIVIFLIGLCLLQFLLTPLLEYLGNSAQNASLHYQFIGVLSEYIFIATCLYKERKRLKEFHLDKMSLTSLVLANFLLVMNSSIKIPNSIYPITFGILGLFMLGVVAKNWKAIPEASWQGLFLSVILTALVLIPTTYISYLSHKGEAISFIDFWVVFIRAIVPSFALAAVSEEIIFRGFLWGYLTQIGLPNHKALILQGVVFWFFHISSLSFLPFFLITIPLVTITYSILAKYTKQVFPSIISHAIFDIFVGLIWKLFVH